MVKFRPVSESDRSEIETWIVLDDHHRGRLTADKFLVPGPQHAIYAVGDEQGTVMYVRQEAEGSKTRMWVQFCPDRKRIMETMRQGFPLVKQDAKKRGFTAVVFDTSSPSLARFVVKELGFRADCEVTL